jgi:hypothetical protein
LRARNGATERADIGFIFLVHSPARVIEPDARRHHSVCVCSLKM